jgi:beta-N-acetylhexosaminidase
LVSDDLSMAALQGPLAARAKAALLAGCDIALHCNGELDEMKEVAREAKTLSGPALLRAQAALCLEIADQMSDPKSREKMRADAAEYHARAAALEEGKEMPRVLK